MKIDASHFQLLVDNSPAIMWIADANANCTYLSRQWYDLTGMKPEEALGHGWSVAIHPDDRETVAESFFKAFENRKRFGMRYRLLHRDGTFRWFVGAGVPNLSPTGDFLGYIGNVVDIHEQVLSEMEMANMRERFYRSARATDLGIWYCDLPFADLIWNDEVKAHFFMPLDLKVTIEDFYNHIHPEDREMTRAAIAKSIAERGPYDIVYRTCHPKQPDNVKWIRAIGWTDYNEAGEPIRFDGITLDRTEEHWAEVELHRAKNEAEKQKSVAQAANESKSRFLANMSHEIRTPLSAIAGYSDLLLAKISSGDPEAASFAGRIASNSTQLGRMIDELLDLSKIEADKLEIQLEPIKISDVIEDVRSTMVLKAEEKNIQLQFECHPAELGPIRTDALRLTQILINVVGNAVKFTENGSIKVIFSIEGPKLVVRVKDTGIGVDTTKHKQVFEPFSQADNTVTRKYGGTGLGLPLSRSLAKLLGGDLVLEESKLGDGSTFRLEIATNLELGKIPHFANKAVAHENQKAALQGKKILIVDDSQDNRLIAGMFLKGAGASIEEAANGQEASKIALEKSFDLILMDIQMPVMDGHQAVKNLRQHEYHKPIVALTAHAFSEERTRCMESGFNGYVTKPINRAGLIKTISDLLH